jgi:transcriptional regulator of NAD metabolism
MGRDREQRQERMLNLLQQRKEPIRGEDLALKLGVTRQVVVHEIALMRAMGHPIVATPQGYYLASSSNNAKKALLSIRHTPEQTPDELYTLIDHGLIVHSVTVEHPIYGELTGILHLRSRHDVQQFLTLVAESKISLLSELTQGYHLHSVEFENIDDVDRAIKALRAKNIEVLS